MKLISSAANSGYIALVAIVLLLPTARAADPVLPNTDCSKTIQEVDTKIEKDKRYAALRDALKSDPNVRCEANLSAGVDKTFANRAAQVSIKNGSKECGPSFCLATYQRMKELLEDYKKKLVAGCEIANKAGTTCTAASAPSGESERFKCIATELRKAAAAETEAAGLIAKAKDEAEAYRGLADEVSRAYRKDQAALRPFEQDAELSRARALKEGKLDTSAPDLLTTINAAYGTTGTNVVTAENGGAPNLRAYYTNTDRLVREQAGAAELATGFRDFARDENLLRTKSAAALETMAAKNELLSKGQAPPPTPPATVKNPTSTVSGPVSTTGASVLPAATSAMAMTTQGANLANNLNQQQQQAAAAAPASMWSQVATAAQGLSGLGSTAAKTGVSPLGNNGSRTGQTEAPVEPGSPAVPVGNDPSFPTSSSGGETFVSGMGDLPVLGGASLAGRSVASTAKTGKVSGGGGADVSASKKKKEAEAPACGNDKQCIASLGLETLQFSKSGGLGTSTSAAADGGLGSLENLFGPLPTDPASGAVAQNNTGIGGMNWGAPEGEVYAAAPGVQSADGPAPDSSRSLFTRVRTAHENALKRGMVTLFHKKL